MDALFRGQTEQGNKLGHKQYANQSALVIGASPAPDGFACKITKWAGCLKHCRATDHVSYRHSTQSKVGCVHCPTVSASTGATSANPSRVSGVSENDRHGHNPTNLGGW